MHRFFKEHRKDLPDPDKILTQADLDQINARHPPFVITNNPRIIQAFQTELAKYDREEEQKQQAWDGIS